MLECQDLQIEMQESAYKCLNRFKDLSAFVVEDIVREHTVNDEEFLDFLDQCNGPTCNNIYDKDENITIFTSIDDNTISIDKVKRGDKRFEDFC